ADHYAAEALPFLTLAAVVGTGRTLRRLERRWPAEPLRAASYVALGLLVTWNLARMPSYVTLAHGRCAEADVIVIDPLGSHWPFADAHAYQDGIRELMALPGRRLDHYGPLGVLVRDG